MILPRHPDLMSNEDLEEWVLWLVSSKQPESIFLDYKATITTDSRSDKREVAKDISSFANERGGVVLYGIPEARENGEPVPVDIDDIGMDSVSGLPQVIEDILVGALMPRLPELRVREIPLMNLPDDKVVYLVWHPESWEAPHMLHAYGEHRYYKRGNFRTVLMEEGEVERLYRRRQARRALATQFLEETDFAGPLFPRGEQLTRIVVCPAFPFDDRVDFSQQTMQDWVRHHYPEGSLGWIPFIYGVRSISMPREPSHVGLIARAETRLFRNGACSICKGIADYQEGTLNGWEFLKQLDCFLHTIVGRFYEQIGMAGDVLIDVAFLNVNGKEFNPGVSIQYEPRGQDSQWHSDVLQFQVTASATDLMISSERWALEQRIMDRLAQCFGLWSIHNYFRPDGSPAAIKP
jgi:hypothetical protein